MNNLQPFEKRLADQLQQLPVPDREEGWKEMRKMLDRELPEGGTAWSGNRKWWWMGITVALIITGLWMSEEHRKKELASSAQNFSQDKSSNNPIHSSANDASDKSINNNSKVSDQNTNHTPSIVIKNPESHEQNSSDVLLSNHSAKNEKPSTNSAVVRREHLAPPANNSDIVTRVGKSRNNKAGNSKGIEAGIATSAVSIKASGKDSHSSGSRSNGNVQAQKNISSKENESNIASDEDSKELLATTNLQSISIEELAYQDPTSELSSIPSSYQPLKAEPGKTDKAFQKQSRKQSIRADNRKMTASTMRGDSKEKDQDLTFAAGLALPQSFAIAGQQASSYGVNASSSRASDYLPVPFFQYHMNSRLFFQTELQFQSPQYTDRLLVYQDQQHVPQSTTTLEKNIFIEKLYYFHIPFNVYFSPAKNFYVGSGLQFSSLLSGVATYQSNRYDGSSLQNSYSKVEGFKDDSVASKLSSSEWRYQFDANYYLKRFTFGARYNQALSQLVNIQPSAGLPYTQGRNQSFFIYLRYNIWEERKKGSFYSE